MDSIDTYKPYVFISRPYLVAVFTTFSIIESVIGVVLEFIVRI